MQRSERTGPCLRVDPGEYCDSVVETSSNVLVLDYSEFFNEFLVDGAELFYFFIVDLGYFAADEFEQMVLGPLNLAALARKRLVDSIELPPDPISRGQHSRRLSRFG